MLPIIAAEIPKCHVMHLGGGSGVVCFNGDTVKNVELLELSESRHVEGLRYLTFNGLKYHGIIEEVLTWFESRTAEKLVVRQTILEIERAMTFIPDGLKILTSNDLGRNFAILIPRSCALQQIGYYEENGTLKVDRILFEHLDNVNKAAFLFHEALYKLDRARNQAVDSKKTRLAVARLFNADVAEDKRIELAVEMLMGQDLGVVSPTDFKGSIDVEIVKGGQVMGATIELTFFDSNGLEIAKERRYCVETGTARCRYTIKTTKFSRLKIVDGLLPAFSKNVTQMAVYHDNRLLTTVKGDRLWNDLYLQFVFGH